MTTDEQKLGVIAQAIYEWMSYPDHDGIKSTNDIESVSKDILASLKQFDPEPLEVEVFQHYGTEVLYLAKDGHKNANKICLFWSKEQQEAIDFCAKHGLRVKK